MALIATSTGETLQPSRPAVECWLAVDSGGVASSVKPPLAEEPALPQSSFARRVQV